MKYLIFNCKSIDFQLKSIDLQLKSIDFELKSIDFQLKYLIKESQTSKGLNEQGVKELRKAGFYKLTEKTLNNILKRLNKV